MKKITFFTALVLTFTITLFNLNPNLPQAYATVLKPFYDVSTYEDTASAIHYLQRENILKGNADGTFKPKTSLNRAEWATILVRLSGADPQTDNYNNCFPDVHKEWFAPAVCLAKEQGWVKGYSAGDLAGQYGPARPIQDIEMLTTLARLTNWDTEDSEVWYEPALNFALSNQIYENDNPIQDISRENMAEVIFRMGAAITFGKNQYNEEARREAERHKIQELTNVHLQDYEGAYTQEASTFLANKQNNDSTQTETSNEETPLLLELFQPFKEACASQQIEIDPTYATGYITHTNSSDSTPTSDFTIKCGETLDIIVRISKDYEILPNQEEASKREGIKQGAKYLLTTSIYSQNVNGNCRCFSSTKLIEVETGLIVASAFNDLADCDKLKDNISISIQEIENYLNIHFQPEPEPKITEPVTDNAPNTNLVYFHFTCNVAITPTEDYVDHLLNAYMEPVDENGVINYYPQLDQQVVSGASSSRNNDCFNPEDTIPQCLDPRTDQSTDEALDFTLSYPLSQYPTAAEIDEAALSDFQKMAEYNKSC